MRKNSIETLSRIVFFALTTILLPEVCDAAPPSGPPLLGTVVNKAGQPISHAVVARGWNGNLNKQGDFSPYGQWSTDTKGIFRVPPEGINNWPLFYPLSLFTVDATGKQGAMAVVRKAGDPVKLTLQPLIPVSFSLCIPGWEGQSPFMNITIAPKGGPHAITLPSVLSGMVSLPPGNYVLSVSSIDTITRETPFTISPKARLVDLGTIALQKGPLAEHYGKPAPALTVTEAINVSPKITLNDYRGKWVVIDFWGWWCPPCVQQSIPESIAFYDSHPEWRDRFAILTFHCLEANTVAELTPYLRGLEKNVWKGRSLPFPILLDSTGTTLKEWGITLYPTTILINPQGNVVQNGSLKLLEEKLKEIP